MRGHFRIMHRTPAIHRPVAELPHGTRFLGDAAAGRVCLILYRKYTYLEDKRWARALRLRSREFQSRCFSLKVRWARKGNSRADPSIDPRPIDLDCARLATNGRRQYRLGAC